MRLHIRWSNVLGKNMVESFGNQVQAHGGISCARIACQSTLSGLHQIVEVS